MNRLITYIRQSTAKQLTTTAFVVWLCSLALTGFVIYAKQAHMRGVEILIIGWLSPLVMNFAWFANLFFLYAIAQLLKGRLPLFSPTYAVLFSLDTFRFNEYPLNEGGTTSSIYGYGWGAVLWFVAIFLMLAAVGTRQRELNAEKELSGGVSVFRPAGLTLACITLGGALYLAIHDRIAANPDESERLAYIAFKRGPVCSAPDPVVTHPMRGLSGPLEIQMEGDTLSTIYPLSEIKELLQWGIPTIRVKNRDYAYERGNLQGLVSSIPATGEPGAILYLYKSVSPETLRAKLVEAHTHRIVFDQTWTRLGEASVFCPVYRPFPSENDQPRRLLMQALNLQSTAVTHKATPSHVRKINRLPGKVIEIKAAAPTAEDDFVRWKKHNPNRDLRAYYHDSMNANCPRDIGWDDDNTIGPFGRGFLFMVKDKGYFFTYSKRIDVRCEGGTVYFYTSYRRNGKYNLSITKYARKATSFTAWRHQTAGAAGFTGALVWRYCHSGSDHAVLR